ncbi:hypothetical protein CPC16_002204 [Podila verticillata]|nr:hypothetical protein CPC16_002204 [Podila verticillata]
MSSTVLAGLDSCRSMNYEFDGADYGPSPMIPDQQVCVIIDGKFKKVLPAPGSKLKIEVTQGNLHGDWYNDLEYSESDDQNSIKSCFFLPPSFQTIQHDSKVSVRLSVAHPDNNDLSYMCVQGSMSVV